MVEKIVWLDLETTGLDLQTSQILEVGCVVTDKSFRAVDEFEVVVSVPESTLLDMDDVVRNMHKGTGLWDDVLDRGVTLELAERSLNAWLDRHFARGDEVIPLGGSGVARFDVHFLKRSLPGAARRFHWRMYDVSSVRALVRLAGREDLIPRQTGVQHRAVDDALYAADCARAFVEEIESRGGE